jgi:hypothetical protein
MTYTQPPPKDSLWALPAQQPAPVTNHPRADKINAAAKNTNAVDSGWFESARAAVLLIGTRLGEFTTAEIREASGLGQPTHGAWGPVITTLLKENRIAEVGTGRRANGNRTPTWRVVKQEENP